MQGCFLAQTLKTARVCVGIDSKKRIQILSQRLQAFRTAFQPIGDLGRP